MMLLMLVSYGIKGSRKAGWSPMAWLILKPNFKNFKIGSEVVRENTQVSYGIKESR